MEHKVESFERNPCHLVCSKDGRRCSFSISENRTPRPWTGCYTALHRMGSRQARPRHGLARKACLAVKLLATEPFAIQPIQRLPVRPRTCCRLSGPVHLTSHTTSRAAEVKFLAAFVPYRPGERLRNYLRSPLPRQPASDRRYLDRGVVGPRREGNIRLQDISGEGKIGDPTKNAGHAETSWADEKSLCGQVSLDSVRALAVVENVGSPGSMNIGEMVESTRTWIYTNWHEQRGGHNGVAMRFLLALAFATSPCAAEAPTRLRHCCNGLKSCFEGRIPMPIRLHPRAPFIPSAALASVRCVVDDKSRTLKERCELRSKRHRW